jgi:dihydropteroate synthase
MVASETIRGLDHSSALTPDAAVGADLRAWVRTGATGRPAVVGVVNVTPDSFSDGGRYLERDAAFRHVDRLLREGADVIEVGGESTRPPGATYGAGHQPVDEATQLARVLPVIEYAAREHRALVAIDTTLPAVARKALDAGARIVNDVSCLASVELARLCAERGAWLVLMHSRPGAASAYDDVIADVAREWCEARDRAVAVGLERARIVMDPGIGFGKGARDNLRLLASLRGFLSLGHPLYVGPSRKSFIAAAEKAAGLDESTPGDRLGGTLAACLCAARSGASALRVHDVRALRQAFAVELAIGDASAGRGE